MNNMSWVKLAVSAGTDFIISAGGCILTAMGVSGTLTTPSTAVLIFAGITGLIAAAKEVSQKLMTFG